MASARDLFSLPAGPADLCFDKNEFMKKTFSVDEFLHENRNAGSLEIIRDDLGVYLKVLRSAMIELINQDYADFVDLSANLIGLDQQINGIETPLEKLRDEIMATPSFKLKMLTTLFSDINNLSKKIPQIVTLVLEKSPGTLALTSSQLDEIFFDNRSILTTKLNRLQTLIVQELVQASVPHIKQASDIPRLYRKTNRDVPSRCCQYMELMVQPSREFRDQYHSMIGDERLKEFLANVFTSLTMNYYQAVDEVLTSVQKTEESLRRLKNLRDRNANSGPITTTTGTDRTTMSDDDKIRLQLQVDVIHYVQEIESIGLARGEIEKLDELTQLVEEATKIRIGSRM